MAESGAYSQDVLTRIYNVQWGGGAIVVVGVEVADDPINFGRIYRGTPPKEPPKLQDWTTVVESGTTAFRSISFALIKGTPTAVGESIIEVGGTPTFIMGGGWTNLIAIDYSNDGGKWASGLNKYYDNVGAGGVMGIVWDPHDRAFYAASGATSGEPFFAQRQFWRSPDGGKWTQLAELSSFSSEETDAIDKQITKMLLDHATKPENRGGSDGKVPDGYQAYDPNKKIFMTPGGLKGWSIGGPINSGGATIKIESEDSDGKVTTSSKSFPVDIVSGVSFAGGVWNVLGMRETSTPTFQKPSVVFCSIDDGETWQEVFSRPGWVAAGIVSGDRV
jgi:hypothetical protein